jgi:protein SCO1/2
VRRDVFVAAGLAGLAGLVGAAGACRKAEVPSNAPSRPAILPVPTLSPQAKRYPIKGVVTAVDPAKQQVTVQHEEIPGFMSAMTMPFPIRDDPKVIEFLRPGDRIEARLVVDGPDNSVYFLEEVLTKGFVPTPTPFGGTGIRPEPNKGVAVGEVIPDFTLTDQTGARVKLSQFRGEPLAVTFTYTRCPIATACPLTIARFSKIDAGLKKEGFGALLCVTVDPEHDTPAALADYAKRVGADPKRWKFLTGDAREVASVAERFGVLYYPDKGQIVHSQAVAVVDPDGRLETVYYGEQWEPETVLQDLQKARKG